MTRPAAPPRRGRLAALALSALLALGPGAGPLALRIATGGALVTALVAAPPAAETAEARSRSRSGGYSRPGGSRTPSVGSSRSSGSSSGGYARPRSGGDSGSYRSPSASGSDRDASRGASRSALDEFLSPPPSRTPSTRDSAGSSGSSGRTAETRRPRTDPADPSGYYSGRGYRMPDAYAGRSSFGAFDAIMLWFLLDTISDSSHADFFRNNQNDSGYRDWRAEADRLAADDPALKAKLAQLDRELAAAPGDPAKAGQLPADIPSAGGSGGSFGLVIAVIIIAVVLWLFISSARRRAPSGKAPPKGDSEVTRTVGGDGSALGQAAAILRNKMSGATYTPDFFRVGMPMVLDPTPFILAEGLTKVTPPAALSANGTVGVEAVGTASDKAGTYHRLYLDDEAAFFQLVLSAEGYPAECRYFRRIDEVQPADKDEWAFWLDKTDGMIGWPEFETKDGQLYHRAWSPGDARVQPRALEEKIETLKGESGRKLAAMLYARPTGGAAPAPETEYLLVTAVQTGAAAYVELHAGIDINPTALSLS